MNVNILRNYLEVKPSQEVLGKDQGNSLPCLYNHRTTRLHLPKEHRHYSLLLHGFLKAKAHQIPTVGAFGLAYIA